MTELPPSPASEPSKSFTATVDATTGHEKPSSLIRACMTEKGWNQKDLAQKMHRPSQMVSDILNERKAVTAWTALLLENATGVPAEQFLFLQIKVNLTRARQGYKVR